MYKKNLDIIVVISLCVLNILWALSPYHTLAYVGGLLASPLIFLLPGYVLTQALLPRRSFDRIQQLTFSIGSSFVLVIITGFLLNFSPNGLRAPSWSIFLGLGTLGGAVLLLFLRRDKVTQKDMVLSIKQRLTHTQMLALELAGVITLAAVIYSTLSAQQAPHNMFTQLWLLPTSKANQACTVQIGIQSFEASVSMYNVDITINGTQLHQWSSIILEPQHTWKQQVPLSLTKNGTLFLSVHLYLSNKPQQVYRSATLELQGSSVNKANQIVSCANDVMGG